MSLLTVAALLGICVGLGWLPSLPVCIALVTGDVFYNKPLPDNSLKKWHWANKVAAFAVLGINALAAVWLLRSPGR